MVIFTEHWAVEVGRLMALDYADSLRFLGYKRPQLWYVKWDDAQAFFWS